MRRTFHSIFSINVKIVTNNYVINVHFLMFSLHDLCCRRKFCHSIKTIVIYYCVIESMKNLRKSWAHWNLHLLWFVKAIIVGGMPIYQSVTFYPKNIWVGRNHLCFLVAILFSISALNLHFVASQNQI